MSAQGETNPPRGLPPIGGRFADILGNFQVMKSDNGTGTEPILLEPGNPMFSIAAAIVHLSLRTLEHKPSLAALEKIGIGMCESWVQRREFTAEDAAPIIQDMERLVHYYVRRLRSSFCNLVVAKTGDCFALTKRRQPRWGGKGYKYTGPDDFDPDLYDPKDMGVVVFNGPEEDPMIMELLRAQTAAQQELIEQGDETAKDALAQFHTQLLWFSMVMCHECAHVFTAFLSGLHGTPHWSNTPEEVYANPSLQAYPCEPGQLEARSERRRKGEAGYAFEYFVWGGVSDCRMVADASTEDFYAFKGMRLQIQTRVDGELEDRVVPYQVIKRFIEAPEDFDMGDFLGPDTRLEAVQEPFNDATLESYFAEERARAGQLDSDDFAHLVTALQMETYGSTPRFDVMAENIERFVKNPADEVVPGWPIGND